MVGASFPPDRFINLKEVFGTSGFENFIHVISEVLALANRV